MSNKPWSPSHSIHAHKYKHLEISSYRILSCIQAFSQTNKLQHDVRKLHEKIASNQGPHHHNIYIIWSPERAYSSRLWMWWLCASGLEAMREKTFPTSQPMATPKVQYSTNLPNTVHAKNSPTSPHTMCWKVNQQSLEEKSYTLFQRVPFILLWKKRHTDKLIKLTVNDKLLLRLIFMNHTFHKCLQQLNYQPTICRRT